MNTHSYTPGSDLNILIHSIWEVNGFTSFQFEHIIPKGITEVIFNFSDSSSIPCLINGKAYGLDRCFINGFNTAPIQIHLPGHQHFFGVRFQPLSIKKVFGTPASEFLDIPVDLKLISPEIDPLWHQLAEQKDFNSRVHRFTQWVKKKLTDGHPQEQLMNHFLCDTSQHDLSVSGLAGMLCYSPRHLSRKILEATGMNTEEILHYKKYLHAVHLIHHTDMPLTAIAYQSHFADQSHFIRSFKHYTRMTPGQYKRSKGFQKGHIFENVR